MKVLISAYACRPGWGSEPGLGWNWVREISRFADVYALTRETNRPFIESATEHQAVRNVRWVYVPLLQGMGETHRLQYYLWQQRMLAEARRLHQEVKFDLAHHVTYCAHWMPAALGELGIPFVWGPVGGGEQADPVLMREFPLRARATNKLRYLAQRLFEMDPRLRSIASRATVAFGTTEHTAERLRALGVRDVRVLPSVGLPSEDFARLSSIPIRDEEPRRLISIGRLLHWKGFDLGIEAFASIAEEFPDAEYWIAGDGPERPRLQGLIDRMGLQGRVRLLGFRKRTLVLDDLAECDILLHPSMHDSGGWVTLEAMAAARPVICLDAGGPALQVNGSNGFKVSPGPREDVVQEIATAIRSLLSDRDTRTSMGLMARSFVHENFHYPAIGNRMRSVYEEIFGIQLTPAGTPISSQPR